MSFDADLLALLVAGGILTPLEAEGLSPETASRIARDPYALTISLSDLPAPALRWRWQPERAPAFCSWVQDVLRTRFDVALEVTAEPDSDPVLLRLRLGGRDEVVDWAYLNSARWIGSFCTMAARLLAPRGVTALELETGDLDTVILFCRSSMAAEVEEALEGGG